LGGLQLQPGLFIDGQLLEELFEIVLGARVLADALKGLNDLLVRAGVASGVVDGRQAVEQLTGETALVLLL